MDAATLTFDRLRPRLQSLAYRMLGSVAEAEEVVQDAWLRWHATDPATLDSAEAWLVTVATRLSIDRLRSLRAAREHYVGEWLPEPLLDEAQADAGPSPERLLERADQLSIAFLAVLERLAPEARAAFLLREVFDADYDELARVLGKSQAACRQIVHRAKAQVREGRPRYAVPADAHRRLLGAFAQAMQRGDYQALTAVLADEAELIGDGGGKVRSVFHPLRGGGRIAQLYVANHRRHGATMRIAPWRFNGEWGLLRWIDGRLESAQAVETDGRRIVRLRVQRNPDKLARLAAAAERLSQPPGAARLPE